MLNNIKAICIFLFYPAPFSMGIWKGFCRIGLFPNFVCPKLGGSLILLQKPRKKFRFALPLAPITDAHKEPTIASTSRVKVGFKASLTRRQWPLPWSWVEMGFKSQQEAVNGSKLWQASISFSVHAREWTGGVWASTRGQLAGVGYKSQWECGLQFQL